MYIYQYKKWPDFHWDTEAIQSKLSEVRYLQGMLLGKMSALGFPLKEEALLETLTLDVLKSSEIEGENLNREEVRSSLARKLGMEQVGLVPTSRNTEGVVDMLLDATQQFRQPLSKERLLGWNAALFPTGYSGIHKITTGDWRTDESGPMQVVSGAMGRERVHFQAPKAEHLETEMAVFLDWANGDQPLLDPILKSAIAHLWFVTIHPFEDGNGRIARAIADLFLARADRTNLRFYSMSAQIRIERKSYYDILEKTQKDDLDITEWVFWFLNCLERALDLSTQTTEKTLTKARFWEKHSKTILNPRQVELLNRLLDGFTGKLTSSKWASIAKCSTDTALRDIQDLMKKDILVQEKEGGRSTAYKLKMV